MGAYANQLVWIVLLILAYLLVTSVFTVLSYSRKRAIDIHDRVRECMEIRRKYMVSIEQAKNAK